MSDFDDGGPAFPHDDKRSDGAYYATYRGASLRDLFAMTALPVIIRVVSEGRHETPWRYEKGIATLIEAVAGDAYDMADAMLKMRGRA